MKFALTFNFICIKTLHSAALRKMVFIHRLKDIICKTTFAPNMENGTNCNFLEKQLRFFALLVTYKIFI